MTADESNSAAARAGQAPVLPEGVGRTALMVALMRAGESKRADRLFDDPYAGDFVTAGGADAYTDPDAASSSPMADVWNSFATYAPIRTRFFDDYLLGATGPHQQVVILAAGLDTRAYRLPWPADVTLYELDSPEVLKFKQHVLDERGAEPNCRRVAVPVDLREDWAKALTAAGFDPAVPTAWLIEGLVSYLSPADNDKLLSAVTALSAPGSQLSVEYLHVDTVQLMTEALTGGDSSGMRELWESRGVAESSPEWLARHGWDAEESDAYERAESYGRALPPLGDTPMDRFADAARNSLVIGRRR